MQSWKFTDDGKLQQGGDSDSFMSARGSCLHADAHGSIHQKSCSREDATNKDDATTLSWKKVFVEEPLEQKLYSKVLDSENSNDNSNDDSSED